MRQPWRFWRFWRFRRLWRFRSWRLPPLNPTPFFRHPEQNPKGSWSRINHQKRPFVSQFCLRPLILFGGFVCNFGCVFAILFVHNSVCLQFLEGVFAILAECSHGRLFIILFVRSQFWLSVRNSVWGPSNRNSRGNPSFCWLGGGVNEHKNCEQNFCEQTGVS